MNDTQGLQIPVQPGKTYFIRIINMAAFAAQNFWIDGHTFRIIEVDGVYTEPTEASLIYITAAQRYGILLTTKNETDANFAIMGSMDEDLFDVVPDGLNANVTSYLVYDASLPMPDPPELAEFEPFDDMELVPTDGEELYTDPSLIVQLDVAMDNLGDGAVGVSGSPLYPLGQTNLSHRTMHSSVVSLTSPPRFPRYTPHCQPENSPQTPASMAPTPTLLSWNTTPSSKLC